MVMEKTIFTNWSELSDYLESKGFVIDNGEMRWGEANVDSDCYWSVSNTGTINFVDSTGENAFHYDLTDFENDKNCGCVFVTLANDGCILYLTPLDPSTEINQLGLNCRNGYSVTWDGSTPTFTDMNLPLQNGLVVCTPAESDGYWRYSWRHWDSSLNTDIDGNEPARYFKFNWCIDNCRGIVSKGTEVPNKFLMPAQLTCTLNRAYLNNIGWSNHIYVHVLGQESPPGCIFKIGGEKFISITDNYAWRAPVFMLPPEEVSTNISTSTEAFSNMKTYKVGDYCIYNGYLYKCTVAITIPHPFDSNEWLVTTVYNERITPQ